MTKRETVGLRPFTTLTRALGDRTRVRILFCLQRGELCVCQVAAAMRLSQSTVSRHLSILRAADCVVERRDGRWVFFRIARGPSACPPLLRWLPEGIEDPILDADGKRLDKVLEMPIERVCGSLKR
jgi:DNA-binding transcriptional ArsR family regulator